MQMQMKDVSSGFRDQVQYSLFLDWERESDSHLHFGRVPTSDDYRY
jgi:hypothetical protein